MIALGLDAMLAVALQTRDSVEREEFNRTDDPPTADELTQLSRDYDQVPREVPELGLPLPGDLGRPLLRMQQEGQPVAPPPIQPLAPMDAEEQRRLAEREAARTSALFADVRGTGAGGRERTAAPSVPHLGGPTDFGPPAAPTATDNRQAFLDGPVDRSVVNPDRIADPASPFLLQAGSVIPAALTTGLRSDLTLLRRTFDARGSPFP